MTVSATSNKIVQGGNSANTTWAFSFPAVAAADLIVTYTSTTGVLTTINPANYTVTLNPVVLPNVTPSGGTVAYPIGGGLTPDGDAAVRTGASLTIYRNLASVQATSLASQGTTYPGVIEQALDYITLLLQQVQELQNRSIAVAVSDPNPNALPAVAARANQYMSFDASGNPTAVLSSPGTTPISSVMAGFVNSASLAAARTTLGLGAAAVEGIGAGLQDDGSGNLRANLHVPTVDSTNQTVTSAFHDTHHIATAALTYTFPRANTLFAGYNFWIENRTSSGMVTLAIDSHDTWEDYSSGTSLLIGPGAQLLLWTDAAASGTWYFLLIGGKTGNGDSAYTITPGDRTVVTTATLTTPRTWTLPSAASFKAGTALNVIDEANGITSTNTLTISRAGSDNIVAQGTTVTTFALASAGAACTLISDGSSKWLVQSITQAPIFNIFTSGSAATYTTPVGARLLRGRMIAGGAGGGAATTNPGTNGGDTSFGTWTAIHGVAGGQGPTGSPGTGGTGGVNGTGTVVRRINGGAGGGGLAGSPAGFGGNGPFGGAGQASSGSTTYAGGAAAANTGAGGCGGSSAGSNGGGGGGAGEFVEFVIPSPAATYTYTVGAGGAGGTAGAQAGGAGAAGRIEVEAYF